MRLGLFVVALAGILLAGFTVATRDVDDRVAVALVIAGATLAVAGVATLVALALEERAASLGRARRGPIRRGRAVRRGLGLGIAVGALAVLRAVDGLSLITATFVLAGFVLAEYVLSSRRPSTRSG